MNTYFSIMENYDGVIGVFCFHHLCQNIPRNIYLNFLFPLPKIDDCDDSDDKYPFLHLLGCFWVFIVPCDNWYIFIRQYGNNFLLYNMNVYMLHILYLICDKYCDKVGECVPMRT